MNNQTFVIERVLNAPVEKVWAAITDEHQMRQWYFDLPGFKAEAGYKFSFTGGPDGRQYLHLCCVTEVLPQKKLAYTWRYDGYDGDSLVTWELYEENGRTRVKLTHAGLETFPISNPDLAKENFVAGWKHIVGVSLKEYAEK